MRQLEPFPGVFLLADEVRRHSVIELPPQLPQDVGKLTVVLDIDETLVHTELISGGEENGKSCDVQETVASDIFVLSIQGLRLRVQKRPFLDSFLREASKRFELIAFTAGAEEYAQPLLDCLDPEGKIFRHRLFRQHCFHKEGLNFIKDLRILNRSLRRTVLVDNNAHSFFMQLENGIPIASFFNDVTDKALISLYHFLETIDTAEDVRFILTRVFGLDSAFGVMARNTQTMIMQHA